MFKTTKAKLEEMALCDSLKWIVAQDILDHSGFFPSLTLYDLVNKGSEAVIDDLYMLGFYHAYHELINDLFWFLGGDRISEINRASIAFDETVESIYIEIFAKK